VASAAGHLLAAFLIVTLLPARTLGVGAWRLFQQDVALESRYSGRTIAFTGRVGSSNTSDAWVMEHLKDELKKLAAERDRR
jgi:hypothetical protein